ncbi:MAG: hypothetical protein B6244_01685 [Candidatus Cloacimonetes bacterium 4572_55]|nr:MAG: hypothetical protein B6244_01685 [Candidatus Cloacimonetes bacterium 4572_55]
MKKILFSLLFVAVIAIALFGFLSYQKFSQVKTYIGEGDAYYRQGEYQRAVASYQHANQIHHTSQADERILRTRDMANRKGQVQSDSADTRPEVDTTAVVGADTTTAPVEASAGLDPNPGKMTAPPSFDQGPNLEIIKPSAPFSPETLETYIKTYKKTRTYGSMEVMLNKPDDVTESIAAQILDSFYLQFGEELREKLEVWPQARVILYDSPAAYQGVNYEKSKAYMEIEEEKIRLIWTEKNSYYELYIDQLETHSLYSLYFVRQEVARIALPYYDKLKQDVQKAYPDDEQAAAASLKEQFGSYIKKLADQVGLRPDQIEQTIRQTRPDIEG